MTAVAGLAAAGVGVVLWGVAALWMRVLAYLDSGLPLDSDSGLVVFHVGGGGYFSYRPFEAGVEPWLIGAGLGMLVLAAFAAAVLRRPKMG